MVCLWKNVASSDCSSTLSRARASLSCERGDSEMDECQDVFAELDYTSRAHMIGAPAANNRDIVSH